MSKEKIALLLRRVDNTHIRRPENAHILLGVTDADAKCFCHQHNEWSTTSETFECRGNDVVIGSKFIELLDTDEFPRLKIGVGRGAEDRDLADYVLARFEPDEQVAVKSTVDRAADAVEMFVLEGIERAMNEFNRNTEEVVTETGEFD